jgi:hypothetical protein
VPIADKDEVDMGRLAGRPEGTAARTQNTRLQIYLSARSAFISSANFAAC